jgi:hypothetical protein
MGPTARHGQHHGAHRSTSTGSVAAVRAAKEASSASTSQPSGLWHAAQRGVPVAADGTRLRRPHDAQTIMDGATVACSGAGDIAVTGLPHDVAAEHADLLPRHWSYLPFGCGAVASANSW